MTIVKQLFTIVSANDYENLEKIIHTDSQINFNCIDHGKSLIAKAIQVRSLECFDLLMDLPNLTVLQTGSHCSGLAKALDYYVHAPNPSNKHYLDRLIERNALIDVESMNKCFDCPILFDMLFTIFNKNENIKNLICVSIVRKNINIMNKLFDWINTNNPPYYSTQESRSKFNDYVFCTAVSSNNILAIDYFEKIGYDIMRIEYGQTKIPTIYYLYKCEYHPSIFNHIYFKMEKMDENTIGQIYGIRQLHKHLQLTMSSTELEYLIKILTLPIDWEDLSECVILYICSIYSNFASFDSSLIRNKLLVIYSLLKTNKLKKNPFEILKTPKIKKEIEFNFSVGKFSNPPCIELMKSTVRKIKYVLNNFGFEEHNLFSEHYKSVFDNKLLQHDKLYFSEEENNCILELEVLHMAKRNKIGKKIKKTIGV